MAITITTEVSATGIHVIFSRSRVTKSSHADFRAFRGDGDDSMGHYGTLYHQLAACALTVALLSLTPSAIAAEKDKRNMIILSDGQIGEMFRMLDHNKDGRVSLEELFLAIKSGKLGLLHSEPGCRAFMKAADSNADGYISMKEFTGYVRKREADLHRVFDEIDKDGDGKLSVTELKAYLERALVKKVSLDDAAMLMRKIDTDMSGSIELDELVRATLFSVTPFSEAFNAWKEYVYNLFFPRPKVTRTSNSKS